MGRRERGTQEGEVARQEVVSGGASASSPWSPSESSCFEAKELLCLGHRSPRGGVTFPGEEGAFSGDSCRCKPFATVLTAAGGWTSS